MKKWIFAPVFAPVFN